MNSYFSIGESRGQRTSEIFQSGISREPRDISEGGKAVEDRKFNFQTMSWEGTLRIVET